tara:strand:- start:162 stop:965 length:804 start_codon:yes stop_codon:yes gene_type:complete
MDSLDETDFYKKYYRKILFQKDKIDHEYLQIHEEKKFKKVCEKIKKIINLNNEKVLVIGGGVGGILKNFKNSKKIFTEYDIDCINFAKKNLKDTQIIFGASDEVIKLNIKPKLVIITHVIEHWLSLNKEFQNLKKICTPNETYVFIETPGIDSSKVGRRRFDFSGDIFYGHKYYFSSYVLNDYFKVNNFDCIFSNSIAQGLYLYNPSSQKKKFDTNNYKKILNDLKLANVKLIFYRLSIFRICKAILAYIKKIIKFLLINLKRFNNK